MTMHKVAYVLVIIGGLNWGLVGLGSFFQGDWNLVDWIFVDLIGQQVIADIVYVVVGISALMMLGSRR